MQRNLVSGEKSLVSQLDIYKETRFLALACVSVRGIYRWVGAGFLDCRYSLEMVGEPAPTRFMFDY